MRRQSGYTLVETLITVAVTLTVIAMILSAVVFTYRTFAGIGNYVQLNRQTREAMDKMARDIRQTAALTNGTSTSLSFTNFDGSLLRYQYDPSAQTLTYSNAATRQGGTLLQDCISCQFSLFEQIPSAGSCMLFTNTATASLCKVIQVNWICRTTNLLSLNSEMMETTRIVMRN